MKILLAEPDRDFLHSFKTLLELDGNRVTTIFDGTQVITKLAAHSYDIVIMDMDIPRISYKELVELLHKKDIPVILLSEKNIGIKILNGDVLGDAFLSFPFLPGELTDLIEKVVSMVSSVEVLRFADAEIDIPEMKLCGTLSVTCEEAEVFKALINKEDIDSKKAGKYISSLNHKLEKLNKKPRIRYLMNEGYRLVT